MLKSGWPRDGIDERSMTEDRQARGPKDPHCNCVGRAPDGTGLRPLGFASRISECHPGDFLEQPVDVVVVEDFHIELEVLIHDGGGAGRRDFQVVAVLLL